MLEVTNTPWGERAWYVFDATRPHATETVAKAMHVSPFLPMELEYRVSWTPPDADLRLDIVVERAGTTVFSAALALRRRRLDRGRAVWLLVRYPLMPLRVTFGIYRHAVALFLRRTPLYRHPARSVQEVGA